jgi:two-component system cell cycle sensor histidine kinase PleC
MTTDRDRGESAEQANLEFMDLVSHELKQPLTAILGYAKMLMMGIGGELTDTQRQFAEAINANSERMGRLVNDLLEISRLEAGRIHLQLSPTGIQEIVDQAGVGAQAEIDAQGHTLEVEVCDVPPTLTVDRERVLQILDHLLRNACMYTQPGGTIRVRVEGDGHPQVPTGQVRVSVCDSGIGLSPKEMTKLGERFYRSDHELVRAQRGAGVGLAITRHLIELHGSELKVESRPGEGSTFSFTLPVKKVDGSSGS